jgi:hypothetical protein
MTMAYKGIIGKDMGMSMPIGITCVAVAAGFSAAGIGRPSAGIGRVISGEIGHSLRFIRPAAEPHSAADIIKLGRGLDHADRTLGRFATFKGTDAADYQQPLLALSGLVEWARLTSAIGGKADMARACHFVR